ERRADANVHLVAQLRRRRVTEEAPALAGHVVGDVDRLLDVAARLGLHLPHLVRHQVGERRLLLLEQAREAEEDLAAFRRGHAPPLREGSVRARARAVDILDAGAREDADRLAVRRARALEGLAGDGVHPLAADEVLESLCRSRHRASLAAAPIQGRKTGPRYRS